MATVYTYLDPIRNALAGNVVPHVSVNGVLTKITAAQNTATLSFGTGASRFGTALDTFIVQPEFHVVKK